MLVSGLKDDRESGRALPALESPQLFADPARQGCNSQIIRMLDQPRHEHTSQASIQIEGVPVTLVHVGAVSDGFVDVPRVQGTARIALDVYRGWHRVVVTSANIFPATL